MSHLLMFISSSPHPYGDGLVYDPDGDDVTVLHGGTFTVQDDRYDVLTADPYTAGLVQEVSTDYSQMTRAELEQAARDAGIDNPDDWEYYPTDGSLSAAIETASTASTQQQAAPQQQEVAPEQAPIPGSSDQQDAPSQTQAPQTVPPAEPGADQPTPPPQEGVQ